MSRQSHGAALVAEHQSEWSRIKAADAQRAQRQEFDKRVRDAELASNATPETIRKAASDVAQRMFDRGQMGAEQLQAAAEIARVFQAVGCELHCRTSRYGAVSGGSNDWPVLLGVAYRERYTPWRAEQSKIIGPRGLTYCQLTFALVVDNEGPRQAADRLRVDQRTLKDAVCESLYRYAEIAGWIKLRNLPLLTVLHGNVRAA
jgi:hypothetical protein